MENANVNVNGIDITPLKELKNLVKMMKTFLQLFLFVSNTIVKTETDLHFAST